MGAILGKLQGLFHRTSPELNNGTVNSFNNTGGGQQNFTGATINSGANSTSIPANLQFRSPAESMTTSAGAQHPPRRDGSNTDEQHVEGLRLINRTRNVVGNGNGVVNFGAMTISGSN